MTAELDGRIRSTLRAWADEVPQRVGDPSTIVARATGRRDATRRWLAAAALAAVAAVLVVVAVRATTGTDRQDTAPQTDLSTEPALGDPPMIIYRPIETGWQLSAIVLLIDPPNPTHLEYRFVHDSGRRIELNLYPLGTREATGGLSESATVTVRGRPGTDTTYGGGRYRIDWDEGGRTWEADGYEFDSLVALAASLDGFEVPERALWLEWLPDEVAQFIEANPGEGLTWNTTDGLEPRVVPTCPPPAAIDAGSAPSTRDDPSSQREIPAPTQLEEVATQLFPGYALDGSLVMAQSAQCQSRRVELGDGTARGFAWLDVSDVPGLQSAEPLRSTGVYVWENPGVLGISILTSSGREAGVTVGMPDPETEQRVRDPVFAERLRASVEALGY